MKILVTRPRQQAEEWLSFFTPEQATLLFQPTIEIAPPEDGFAALDGALRRLADFDWVVFSSSNGVRYFLERAEALGLTSQLPSRKFAAIGPGTQKALETAGIPVSFVPEVFQAENLAAGLVPYAQAGATFLLIRASRGREVLAETLKATGGENCVTQAVAYASRDVTPDSDAWNPEILRQMQNGEIDWTTVTSSAIANALVRLFGDALRQTRLVSISPLTTAALEKHGLKVALEAPEATMASMAECIRNHG